MKSLEEVCVCLIFSIMSEVGRDSNKFSAAQGACAENGRCFFPAWRELCTC